MRFSSSSYKAMLSSSSPGCPGHMQGKGRVQEGAKGSKHIAGAQGLSTVGSDAPSFPQDCGFSKPDDIWYQKAMRGAPAAKWKTQPRPSRGCALIRETHMRPFAILVTRHLRAPSRQPPLVTLQGRKSTRADLRVHQKPGLLTPPKLPFLLKAQAPPRPHENQLGLGS